MAQKCSNDAIHFPTDLTLSFSNITITLDSTANSITNNILESFREQNIQNSVIREKLLLSCIKKQATEIERFSNATSNLDFILDRYKTFSKEFRSALKKQIDLTDTQALKSDYFDMRDLLKSVSLQIELIEKRMAMRPGSAAPSFQKHEMYE